MKIRISAAILLVLSVLFLTATAATAEESAPSPGKAPSRFSVGVGTYALVIDSPSPYDDMEFYGGALNFKGTVNKHVAVRGTYYAMEYDDNDSLVINLNGQPYQADLDVTGLDVQLLVGTNFFKGFNAFAGVGMFHETMEASIKTGGVKISDDKDFSGALLSLGVGYNWERASLEYIVSFRDTSDYEDFSDVDHDGAASGSLSLSYRF